MSNAAATVIDVLEEAGVRRFYTVPGESFLELMDEVERRPGLQLISTRHESGAAFMAEADAKVTGRPAVAMATRAVGATNLAIGIHTARQDSTPMIALLGQVETDHLGKEAFQEVDLPALLDELSVFGATVHRPDRAGEITARAVRAARGDRPGPAVLAFPADVLPGDGVAVAAPTPTTRPTITSADLDRLFELVARASRPVMIVGEGVQDAHGELVDLAEAIGAGVYSAFRRQDVFPNGHDHYLGHLTLGTAPELLAGLEDADLVLVLGSRLDEVTTQTYRLLPRAGVPIVQVDRAERSIGAVVPVALGIHASPAHVARALADKARSVGHRPDVRFAGSRTTYERASDPTQVSWETERGVHPAAVMAALRDQLSAETIVTNDAGNFSVFAHRFWRFDHPRTQVAPVSGAMGYAVPSAVAASLAAPGRPVLGLVGDGGFLMSGQELETAARCGADPLVVVFQNQVYGTIAMHQLRSIGQTAAVDISDVDLAGYARSLGATTAAVDEPADLAPALRTLLDAQGPRVLVVQTDPDVLTPSLRRSELTGSLS